MMKYVVQPGEKGGICTIVVTGEVIRPEDSIKLQGLARELQEEHGYACFLFDLRAAQVIAESTMQSYDAGVNPQLQGLQPQHFRVALVYSGISEDDRFMETVLVNRGYDFRIFDDFDQASMWLRAALT